MPYRYISLQLGKFTLLGVAPFCLPMLNIGISKLYPRSIYLLKYTVKIPLAYGNFRQREKIP